MKINPQARQALIAEIRNAETPHIVGYPHIIICGPSGSGKSTLIRAHDASLVKLKPSIFSPLVSGATRRPRPWEKHGEDYFFMTQADFGIADFFETNEYTGNSKLYGTLESEIRRVVILEKKRMLLDIDPNGAMAFQEEFGNNVRDLFVVFLDTTIVELEKRLIRRLKKTPLELTVEERAEIDKRLLAAEKEKQLVESKRFIPNLRLPYDDILVPEASNEILFKAQNRMLQMA